MLPDRTSLAKAILAVQAEAPTLPKDKTNPHFGSKFTGLETITEKIGPILQKHGLIWMTFPGRDHDGQPALRYSLTHAESGETDGDTMPLLLGKGDMQSFGSAVTYARRYALCAVLGLVADEDDDGNAAATNPRGATSGRPSGKPSEPQQKLIKTLVTQKKVKPQQLWLIAQEIGAPVDVMFEGIGESVKVNPGWLEHLTAGKEGTASLLITYLKERPLPDPANPSDVPNDFPAHEQPGGEVPFQ